MKIIKTLFILIFTLILTLTVILLLRHSGNISPQIAAAILIYSALVYLVWPLGTSYSEVAYKRLFNVLGLVLFLIAIKTLLSKECPILPAAIYTKSGPLEAGLMVVCSYFGVHVTALTIFLLGCYIIYVGLIKKN